MLLQFLVGTLVSVINIGIHALVTIVAVGIARGAGLRQTRRPRAHLMGVMVDSRGVAGRAYAGGSGVGSDV